MKKYLLLLMLSGSCWSHEFLTEMLVFNDEYAINPYHVAISYDLTEADLIEVIHVKKSKFEMNKLVKRSASSNAREFRKVGATDCDFESEGMNKTCGVFDHFSGARSAAIDLCNAYALAHAAEYPHGLLPQFTAPSTFTDGSTASVDHHVAYKYMHGLSFNCVQLLLKKQPYQVKQ